MELHIGGVQKGTAHSAKRVNQPGDRFTPGGNKHVCPLNRGIDLKTKVQVACFKRAREQPFTSARRIVEEVVRELVPIDRPMEQFDPEYLARQANRRRQNDRPRHPKNLNFEIIESAIPYNFLLVDIEVQDRHHLIFASNRQIRLLRNARNWFVDATFRVVREPFYQLFSIHAFVSSDGQNVKQVPLLFAVMSGKRACDYRAIYTWIQDNVPDLQVKLITSDFELALWRACTQFLETVSKFVAVCFTGSKQCSEKSKSSV